MSRLFLSCSICGRKQAGGLLSSAAWGTVATAGGELRACPSCKTKHADWEARLVASTNGRVGAGLPADSPRLDESADGLTAR